MRIDGTVAGTPHPDTDGTVHLVLYPDDVKGERTVTVHDNAGRSWQVVLSINFQYFFVATKPNIVPKILNISAFHYRSYPGVCAGLIHTVH